MITAILVLFIFDMFNASVSIPAYVYGTLAILKLISILLALATDNGRM